jgi:hypothetical protein
MTVKDLIEKLKDMPGDAEVMFKLMDICTVRYHKLDEHDIKSSPDGEMHEIGEGVVSLR